ncbi:MAG: hypothetical protein PF495_10985 [Spirochaetales bacterium]|jgi:hypothetical protein|nr:hypothetical protein [Spirochaetales bacterium]
MSESDEESQIYDLTKVEDVFACLEATAMAQASLVMTDPDAAAGLDKVTEALGALSLVIEMGELVQVVEKIVEVEKTVEVAAKRPVHSGPINDLVDFAHPLPDYSTTKTPTDINDDYDDGIVDILTGEKIR